MSDIHKGLVGVVADTTAISKVDPDTNSLLYRGYPVQELAATCTVEEVAHVLWRGDLPSPAELADLRERERSQRDLPEPVVRALLETPTGAHPMDVVRSAVSLLGAHDPAAADSSPEAEQAKAIRLFAQLPTVVALDQRRRRGQEPVAPDPDLGYAANFLAMTFGRAPEAVDERAFATSMILYAEHSFNASTFTARVITSTEADLHSAVTGAVGALKGPLHGGANEAVMAAFGEIGSADRVEEWLTEALANHRKIMGFGHRVYTNGDSRVPTMKAVLDELVTRHDRADLGRMYAALETEMAERKDIKPNLDYPAGPAYHLLGFDSATFTPLFVAARVVGWTAHIMEQRADNALIRPLSEYSGPAQRSVPGTR
ncbi:bifunctional 2-methylcitrate synthase/citrate synthase [Pseudactinotalea sp. HY160]|uniref:bifunctional 2-methylcitrate synthase/citrate synthase n=1 Tax=Pseudactinotalea sp. HY160 TaxID=2654490 RepID=UPI00128D81C6|nr:bifunctional 2-methylcitrate synthase/citrate synthase [Pseudactinotalea sp. HY160]MPV48968.1 bifunctional 2-methylcitrate synthase/citrate synthase [Pseudactinotalea sp. HY160]